MATGGIFPVGFALIGDLVPIKERQVALGRWLVVIMTGNLLGASVAGVVDDLARLARRVPGDRAVPACRGRDLRPD